MPYIDGKRVSQEEWIERYSTTTRLHTGPSGSNPAAPPEIDPEVGAPVPIKPKMRTPRRASAVKAAIADAMGVKPDSAELDDIDVSSLDAVFTEKEGA